MILTPTDLIWLREKKCVLLDGAFDPLHAGHIRYFREAIEAFPSHLMVVAVASDDDIRAKGREPLLDQQTRCTVAQAAMGGGYAIAKDQPTHELISRLKPGAYVKGRDWEDRLPAEQLAACALNDVQIVYLDTAMDSSTDRLRAWAAKEDAQHLEALERIVESQQPPSEPWQPVTDYSFEARKAIEGEHPRLIAEVFHGCSVLDVGCGPGHLVRLLNETGSFAHVCGMDLAGEPDDWYTPGDIADPALDPFGPPTPCHELVICREVLEHLTIKQVVIAVRNLCKLAARFVYVTTRFTKPPAHLLKVDTSDDLDPTHCSMLNQDLLRTLFVLNGGRRRKDLESKLDWMRKGRCLVYEVAP